MNPDNKILYDFDLTEKVSNILSSDFWVCKDFTQWMMPSLSDPVKFTSNVSIFLKNGEIEADIDLINIKLQSPCILNIRSGQILPIKYFSVDFQCSFIVMSKRFIDNLFLLLKDNRAYGVACRNSIIPINSEITRRFESFYSHIDDIFRDKDNPSGYQTMVLAISSFFFEIAYKCFVPQLEHKLRNNNRISDRFLSLVQEHFKKERFLDFYATQLEISPKHLSRTMKATTGFTAVEWIERYVILEAKVMLKSTNLSIQQISDELNFPSQSFFGKYFKKNVGISPKEFRNS